MKQHRIAYRRPRAWLSPHRCLSFLVLRRRLSVEVGSDSGRSGPGEAATRFPQQASWASRMNRNHTRTGTDSGESASFQVAQDLIRNIGETESQDFTLPIHFTTTYDPIQLPSGSRTSPFGPIHLHDSRLPD